jgi:hypothetical protein
MKSPTRSTLAIAITLSLSAAASAQITSVSLAGPIQASATDGVLDEVFLIMLDVTFDNSNPIANLIQAALTGDLNFTSQEGLLTAEY